MHLLKRQLWGIIAVLGAGVFLHAAEPNRKLLNIDFTSYNGNIKTGPAAIGLSAADYWNFWNNEAGAINGEPAGPRWSDKSPTGMKLSVTGAGGWGTGSSDPMLHTYIYGGSRLTATVTNFPASIVDVYVYAHGVPGGENGVITLAVNGESKGQKSTTTTNDWDTPGWTEGNEYVVFRSVAVPAGGQIQIHADPGIAGVAVLNGAQIVATFPSDPVILGPVITKQPASGTVFAGADVVLSVEATGVDLTYQWRLNDVPLEGKTSPTLVIPNSGASNIGIYTVRVTNNDGEVLSKRADWALGTKVSVPLIDINYTAHLNPSFSEKTGPAAIGVETNDYWNVYSRDTTSMYDWRAGGTIAGLKLTDGTSTSASLLVTNAAGAWVAPSEDAMMKSYLYPLNRAGDITSTFSNLPPARYDIYVYAHGNPDAENALVKLRINGVTVDIRNTGSQPGWDAPAWVEGNQFVLFRGIEVPQNTVVDLISTAGNGDIAVMNGVQLAAHPSQINIVTHPVSQIVSNGQPVTFSVQAEGTALGYQWFRNDAPLPGETNNTFNIGATTGARAGVYAVSVHNATAMAISKPATLTVEGSSNALPPVIDEQPVGATLFAGGSITLDVGAEGNGVTYQWKKNGVVLEGKTASSLELTNVSPSDVGSYTVTVSNDGGSVTSRRANISLATAVSGQLMDINYTAHQNAAFEVKTGPAAVGVATNDFWNVYSRDGANEWDWRAGGTVSNLKWTDGTATTASLTVTNAAGAWYTFSDDAMLESYLYPLSRSGAIGSRIENLPPQRYDIYVYAHGQPNYENAAIEVRVGGVSVGTRSTSTAAGWDSAAWIDGNQFVTFSGVEVPAGADVEIISRADGADIALINGIQLAAQPSVLRIVTQPISQTNVLGTRVVFAVQAEGQGTLAYQWMRNGTAIPGATSAEFTIESIAFTDAGGYSVRVQNDAATVTSRIATLQVMAEGGSSGGSAQRNLLNIDYATTSDYGRKVGPAAVGFTTNDHWNVYSRDSQSLVEAPLGMKWSDGTVAGAQMTVQNANGAWGSNAEDIMLHTYLYPINSVGDIASTFTAVPAGLYDIFVYAHGQPANENGVVEVIVNGVSHGIKATSSSADWDSPGWTEGKEYVLFAGVDVPTNAIVQINAKPGISGLSVINGVQFLSAPLAPTAPSILTQPPGVAAFMGETIKLSVTAEGSRPLTYQWRLGGTNLVASSRFIGVDAPYLIVSNALPRDAGEYSVVVKNSLGEVTSSNAVVTVSVDSEAPQVVITSPAAGAHDTSGFALQGSVTDNNGIASVKWFRNGVLVGNLALVEGKFNVSGLRLDPGENVIRVVAVDVAGNEGVADVSATFTVPRALVLGTVAPQQDGSRFVIPISIVSTGGVSGAEFTLTFDTNYLADAQFEWSDSLASGLALVNLETPRRFRAAFALPAVTLVPGSNRIGVVSFRARSVPTTLQTPLALDLIRIFDENGDSYVSGNSANSTAVTITKRKIVGDNNANDRLDVGDASVMLRMVSRLDPVRVWDRPLNDLNKNTDLDPGDVIKVLRTVVGLDSQPQPPVAGAFSAKKSQTAQAEEEGGGSGVTETTLPPVEPPDPVVLTIPGLMVGDKATAAPGDKVTVEVRLAGQTEPISGASFRLEYPEEALRLDNAAAHQLGSLVPAGAVAMWNVSPSQNNYATQDGAISLAISSATAWPANNGVLARFTFTVQPGATALYEWRLNLKNLELSRDGFETQTPGNGGWIFRGHEPTQATIAPSVTFTLDGRPKITFQGDAGAWFEILASSDLTDWASIGVLYSENGTLQFEDSLAGQSTTRFYRTKLITNRE